MPSVLVMKASGGSDTTAVVSGGRPPLGDVLPARRRLTTVFVDMAGSTSLFVHHQPEVVLGVVQCFLKLVAEVASAFTGDVKDYEGDGALLYFDAPRDGAEAALAIRAALADGRCDADCGGGPGVKARISLTVGDVVVGLVGSSSRPRIALVGPSVNVGARLLKQVPPGGIITTGEVFETVRREAPCLAEEFRLVDAEFEVPGADGMTVATYIAQPRTKTGCERREGRPIP